MNRLGRDHAHHLRARTVLRHERALWCGHLGGAYLALREVGVRVMVCADHLALADAVVADGAFHLTPRTVRDDRLPRAVCIRNLKLRDHARKIAPRRDVEVPHRNRAHVVPAVPHQHLQRILARLQRTAEIVSGVEDVLVVSRGRRVEHLVADFASVQRRLVEADARYMQERGGDGLGDGDRLLECRGCDLLARNKRLAVRRVTQGTEILSERSVSHDAMAIGETYRTDERLRGSPRAFFHSDGHRVLAGFQPRCHVAEPQMVPAVHLS